MKFLLTECEVISLMQGMHRNNDGYLVLRLPPDRLQGKDRISIVLEFDEPTKTVSQGKHSARLSPVQFFLLKYVYTYGKVGYEELQDNIWKGQATDTAIRCAVAKINNKLLEGGFSFELMTRHSKVFMDSAA
jgi:DNA-binding response OmpR family regulator